MNYLSTDHLIVYAFLLITLAIGLWAGRGIKDIKEYALANRQFGTVALVLTYLATDIAGETVLDMANSVRTEGVIQVLAVLGGCSIARFIQALFFAPNVVQFGNCITMGDIMGELYKGPSQIITGILGFFTALCIAGMEITVLGILCETILGIDYRWGVGVGGLILVAYTAHGGIKSVTITDLFQFIVLLVVIPTITVEALKQAGGTKQVLMQVSGTQLQLFNHPKASQYLALFLSLSIFQFADIDPALVQRMLMGQSKQQVRNQFFIIAAFLFTLMSVLLLLGFTSTVLYPDTVNVTIVPHMIRNIMPVGLQGLAAAGIFAITMSTFDSFLHAAGLTLVHDVIRPLSYGLKKKEIDELTWVRYVTVLAGFVAIAVGLARADDLYNFVLVSYEFTGPLLAFPLWLGIMGLKPDQRAFYTAAGVTTIVLILAKCLVSAEHSHWVPIISVLTNGTVFLGVHVMRNKGFVTVSRAQNEERIWQPYRENFKVRLQQLIPTPWRIVQYSQTRVRVYGASYVLLGIFCILNYLLPFFMWEHEQAQTYDLMLYLRFTGAMACGLLVVKDKWPDSLRPYLPTFWHLTLLYCIPFTSTIMFLLTKGSTEWLINVAMTIMFLIVLVDWVSFLILTSLGIALGFLFYTQVVGPVQVALDFTSGYLLVYQGVFATLIGLLFARRRQQRFDQLALRNQALKLTDQENKARLLESNRDKARILQALRYSGTNNLIHLIRLATTQRRTLGEVDSWETLPTTTAAIENMLVPMAMQLRSLEDRATNALRLKVDTVGVQALLDGVKKHLEDKGYQLPLNLCEATQHQTLTCDPERMRALLTSSITVLQPELRSTPLYLALEDTELHYPLPSIFEGYVKKIPAIRLTVATRAELPAVKEHYEPQFKEEMAHPETAREVVLVENRRVVRAHYGATEVHPGMLCYVIPVDVREVRPKDLDKPHMELGAVPVRADDASDGAQAIEKLFLQEVAEKSDADLETVKWVVELIKWYHGPVKRKSGEPFYLHPISVARIVLDFNADEATILAALLHDTVEDTAMLLEDIEVTFGEETAGLIDRVTRLESHQKSSYKVQLNTEETLLMLEEAEDERALYVKVADRLHNMRTISAKPWSSQHRSAQETLDFFVPLCQGRLKLYDVAGELLRLSHAVLRKQDDA